MPERALVGNLQVYEEARDKVRGDPARTDDEYTPNCTKNIPRPGKQDGLTHGSESMGITLAPLPGPTPVWVAIWMVHSSRIYCWLRVEGGHPSDAPIAG